MQGQLLNTSSSGDRDSQLDCCPTARPVDLNGNDDRNYNARSSTSGDRRGQQSIRVFSHVVLADVDVPAGSTSVLQVSKYRACCGVASLLYYCSAMSIEFARRLNSKLGALRATGHRIVLFAFPIILRR